MAPGEQVNMRLDAATIAAIDRIVDTGAFETRSEFVKYCVRMTLKSYQNRGPPPLGLREHFGPPRSGSCQAAAM